MSPLKPSLSGAKPDDISGFPGAMRFGYSPRRCGARVAGCSKPVEEIVPYVQMPEGLVPGEPLRFATAVPMSGYGLGIMGISVDGRPIKIKAIRVIPPASGRPMFSQRLRSCRCTIRTDPAPRP